MPAEAYEILPGRFFIRGGTRGLSLASKQELLARHRVGAVVCLINKEDPDLLEMHVRGTCYYVRSPVPDSYVAVDVEAVEAATKKVLRFVRIGIPTLAHCIAGKQRSGAVAARVVMEELGVSGSEAVAIVRRTRPSAVTNPVFEEWLNRLDRPTGKLVAINDL